jgi:hypothetical protein
MVENYPGQSTAILKIEIENVGVGPAIGLRLDYLFSGVIPPDPERRQAYLPALAAGANNAMALLFNGFTWAGNDCQVTVTFRDVFQNHYQMACNFVGGDRLETTEVVLDALASKGERIERIIGDGGEVQCFDAYTSVATIDPTPITPSTTVSTTNHEVNRLTVRVNASTSLSRSSLCFIRVPMNVPNSPDTFANLATDRLVRRCRTTKA